MVWPRVVPRQDTPVPAGWPGLVARRLLAPRSDPARLTEACRALLQGDAPGDRQFYFTPSASVSLALILKERFEPGDEVLVPAISHDGMASAVAKAGLLPRVTDVDRRTLMPSAATIRAAATDRTRGLLLLHVGGLVAPMDELVTTCADLGIEIIEDCTHAVLARYRGRTLPYTDTGLFSVGFGKDMGGLGGAVVVTRDERIGRLFEGRTLRLSGRRRLIEDLASGLGQQLLTNRFWFQVTTYPLLRVLDLRGWKDDLFTVLSHSRPSGLDWERRPVHGITVDMVERLFDRLPDRVAGRVRAARHLRDRLHGVPGIELPSIAPGSEPCYYIFPVIVIDRAGGRIDLARRLLAAGVDVRRDFFGPSLSTLPAFSKQAAPCPAAESIAGRLLYLPAYPGLSQAVLDRIAETVAYQAALPARSGSCRD